MRKALLVAGAVAAVLAPASPAAANGRFPASNQIIFSPTNDQLIVLRTTFGILPSYDDGTTWKWLCEDAIGLPPTSNEDPSLELTQNNSLVAGLSLGLLVSADTGCSWSTQTGALQGQLVKDLDVSAAAPDSVFAVTSTFEPDGGTDGGAGYLQHVFSSTDNGVHWGSIGTIDPAATVTTIDVAPSDAKRIYVSAYRGENATRTASIFVSADGAQTWNEYPTPLDPGSETAVYIAAVDPKNEDLLYVRSQGSSRLFVSSDGGKTYSVAYSLGDEMLGFALSEDGSKVFLGGPNTGLFVASSADLKFSAVPFTELDGGQGIMHVQCLATHGGDLWACSDEVSGFVAGVSKDDGVTFTPSLHLLGIAGPATCPAGTSSAMCTTTNSSGAIPYNPFASLCTSLSACEEANPTPALTTACDQFGACGDAGASGGDGGTGAGGDGGGVLQPPPAAPKSSGGCSEVGGEGAAGAFVGLGIAAIVARRRRRR